MILLKQLVVFLLVCELGWSVAGNDIIGCGGFIKSNTEINYKIIKVKLVTKDGVVKYTTESSPVNGYYMIPIYNKGEYVLQVNPPPGWSFEPTEVSVNVDGQNDPCSKNEDINFFFKGFGLSGKVVTFGDAKNNGPSGVKLNLISSGQVIDSTLSGADGSYYFSNVMPGAYQVEAQHSTIKFLTSKVSVELSKENWSVKDNILVSGYKIEGYVLASDKSPLKDVTIDLYFNDKAFANIDTKKFECDLSSGSKADFRVCHTRTNADGKFTFSNLAFAKYRIRAGLARENFKFNMEPENLVVDLTKHQDVSLSESFKLSKVSIKTQALLAEKGKGLESGEVYINGQRSPIQLGKDGTFTLSDLSSGTYKISVKSPHVYFEEKLINVDLASSACLDPANSKHQRLLSLTKFIAVAFDVCGQVKMSRDQSNSELFKSVQIKCFQLVDSQPKLLKSVSLNENFEYCLPLDSNSDYVIKSELSDSLAQVLRLVPIERKITVIDSHFMNVNFEQLEARLDGELVLLPKQAAPADLVLTMKSSEDSKRSWTKDIAVKCTSDADKPVRCYFSLTNLLFDNYHLTTNYDELFCWKNQAGKSIRISINSEKQTVLVEQEGYTLNYQLSHKDAVVKVAEVDAGGKVLFTKQIHTEAELSGSLCLPAAKSYNLLIESCHKYTSAPGEVDSVKIEAALFKRGANKLALKAVRTQVVVDIVFKFEDSSEKNRVGSADFFVEAKSKDVSETFKFQLKSESKSEVVFTSKSWFAPGQLVGLVAKSSKVLFESAGKELLVDEHDCASNRVQFEAKLGIFVAGTIRPADIDGIELTLRAGNATLQQAVINGAHGFRLGPLKAPASLYTVELAKPGYLFNQLDATVVAKDDVHSVEFAAVKLGQLKVSVVNTASRASLENVLLSLSSENRLFRHTHRTDSHGAASFDNLRPGLYYLIVMMQEYEFAPNSHPVQIADGKHVELVVEASRTAYSCFGKVASINGQAENDVLVEAVGVRSSLSDSDADNELCKSSQENAKVDNGLGTYRIYNLKPKCVYKVGVKHLAEERNAGQKIVPDSYEIAVDNSDITEKNFVVLEQMDKVDVSLAVSFKPDNGQPVNFKQLNNFVRVKLFRTNQPETVLQTQYSPANSIVYFNSLPRDQGQHYSIKVALLASSSVSLFGSVSQQQQVQLQQQPVLESVELGFYADSTHKHLTVGFDMDKKKENNLGFDFKQQQYQNFYFTLPLFILVVGLMLNSTKVQQSLFNARSFVEQRGGLVKFMQSLVQASAPQPQQSVGSSKSSRYHHQKQPASTNRDSSSNNSDMERPKYSAPPRPAEPKNDEPTEYSKPDSNYSADESDVPVANRRRVRKAD